VVSGGDGDGHGREGVQQLLGRGEAEERSPDAYAPGGNFKDKDFMARLTGLQPGDEVTITFTTDSERYRIVSLKKK
jgi:hypothetical protein